MTTTMTPSKYLILNPEYDLKDTKEPEKSTITNLLIAYRLLKMGLDNNYYTIVSTYARAISDYETILDSEVEDFILRTKGDII